jgi:hypothetical protein
MTMNGKITCEEFQDRLDGLAGGTQTEEIPAALRDHADRCPGCAMLLAMHLNLAADSPGDLEGRVPGALVDTMWQRVSAEIGERRARGLKQSSMFHPIRRALVPAMAAAIVLLVFASGYLLGELRQLRQSEQRLAEELSWKEQAIDSLRLERSSPLGDRSLSTTTALLLKRGLYGPDEFSALELVTYLEQLPPERTIIRADEASAFLPNSRLRRTLMHGRHPAGITFDDGLQVGELILLIEWTGIDPKRRFSREDIVTLTKTQTLIGDL